MAAVEKRSIMKDALKKFKDTVSGAKSVVAIPFNNLKAARANRDADTLIKARKYDDAPSFDKKGLPTDALKARTMADAVRQRRSKN